MAYRTANEVTDEKTGQVKIVNSRRTTHVTIVRTGVWKNRINGGGQGRPGKRKLRGYRKGFGHPGCSPTPLKAFGKRKEEKAK